MAKHLHIMAEEGAIAETVLLPGDPLRAKFIAENYLENAKCYNEVSCWSIIHSMKSSSVNS